MNLLYYQQQQLERLSSNFDKDSKLVSEVAVSSSIDSNTTDVVKSSSTQNQLLHFPDYYFQSSSAASREDEDSSPIAESVLCSSFCSGAGYDANSSTTFSSRANTPHSEMLENSGVENDASLSLLLPPQSSCSSDCSSQHSISTGATNQKNLLPTTVNLSSSNEEQIGNEK
ncbi:unnamed protein product [Meloidogyne enterolobii]|uniref:Uncharacterized protein n=1 Tax=Meloidogyne enterolobii TaxID=390850 RepID=A0ACB0YRB6_MELEN